MPKLSKNRTNVEKVVDGSRKYTVEEACALVKKAKKTAEEKRLAKNARAKARRAKRRAAKAAAQPSNTALGATIGDLDENGSLE